MYCTFNAMRQKVDGKRWLISLLHSRLERISELGRAVLVVPTRQREMTCQQGSRVGDSPVRGPLWSESTWFFIRNEMLAHLQETGQTMYCCLNYIRYVTDLQFVPSEWMMNIVEMKKKKRELKAVISPTNKMKNTNSKEEKKKRTS